MSDIGLSWGIVNADASIEANDLVLDDTPETSVLVSLFTNRRAAASDALPAGQLDPQGWWGDVRPQVEGDLIGSRLWLLAREKQTQDVLTRGRTYVLEALQWMLDDGLASAIDVATSWIRPGTMGIAIAITRPTKDLVHFKFEHTWSALEAA